MTRPTVWRKTTQELAPARVQPSPRDSSRDSYDLYPGFPIGSGKIQSGFASLAQRLAQSLAQSLTGERIVVIDGYIGVFWEDLCEQLDAALAELDVTANWYDVSTVMRPDQEIEARVAPFLGGDDPVFGSRYPGALSDWFSPKGLAGLQPDGPADLHILYGCGAALAGWDGLLVYVDLPKNELQFRSRAGSVTNLGVAEPGAPKAMYKRYYFVDWVVLNQHKAGLLPDIDVIVDGQRPDEPLWMSGDDLRAGLARMSRNFFRVRPWFEPGAWGGQWIKEKIPQLPQDAVNYAWSFELIVPENGLLFESDGYLLEVSFDMLMFLDSQAITGVSADAFGHEFPIRFDFLDTIDGGNLSLQCHPRPDFIRREFGETFTQDETYYILDCTPEAEVYLGFQEDLDPATFRAALEESQRQAQPLDVDRFVQRHPARKHDLFLIPNGTVHCSGAGCMVLEISATPYIFTFKMYDWMRLDLDGKPRPINIERAFENLRFEYRGAAAQELISKPYVLESGPGWERIHQPTHPRHFYDVERYRFNDRVEISTDGSCQVMSLVEGRSVLLETAGGMRQRFAFAETFVVPAAAGSFRLISEDGAEIQVVRSFVKPQAQWVEGVVA